MPKVERNCAYRQSLHLLRLLSDEMIPPADLDRSRGPNVLRLFGVGD